MVTYFLPYMDPFQPERIVNSPASKAYVSWVEVGLPFFLTAEAYVSAVSDTMEYTSACVNAQAGIWSGKLKRLCRLHRNAAAL